MHKKFVIVLVLVIVALGGYFLLRGKEVQAPQEETPTSTMPVQNNETPEIVVNQAENTEKPIVVNQNLITYTNAGYSPSTLNVKLGTIVTFKNNSSLSMWPASAMHPTHTIYPTTGGCLGSTFDACRGVKPGESWSFKFDIAGSWKYHDHLKPGFWGTIVVQ